jgi:carbonic anhydrase
VHRIVDAASALERLRAGNRRFAAGEAGSAYPIVPARLEALASEGQHPFAIVLGCSDSRVPAEIVFDQGLGDLFVIRVAGNIVQPSQIGSVEFAADRFGTQLVVVLGHSYCGAVEATLDALSTGGWPASGNVLSIVDLIRPALAGIVAAQGGKSRDELMQLAVRANVRATVSKLRTGSPALARLARESGLRVVGAEYGLETGLVDFFEHDDGAR